VEKTYFPGIKPVDGRKDFINDLDIEHYKKHGQASLDDVS
jgi:hypothetical protein